MITQKPPSKNETVKQAALQARRHLPSPQLTTRLQVLLPKSSHPISCRQRLFVVFFFLPLLRLVHFHFSVLIPLPRPGTSFPIPSRPRVKAPHLQTSIPGRFQRQENSKWVAGVTVSIYPLSYVPLQLHVLKILTRLDQPFSSLTLISTLPTSWPLSFPALKMGQSTRSFVPSDTPESLKSLATGTASSTPTRLRGSQPWNVCARSSTLVSGAT